MSAAPSSVADLFARYSTLSQVRQRAVAAIVGAIVADAGARPLHWLYDSDKLAGIVGDAAPEFWAVNACPYYTVALGLQSYYGDEALSMLASLPAGGVPVPADAFSKEALLARLASDFSPSSVYGAAMVLRNDPGRDKSVPLAGPWQGHILTHLLTAAAAGGPTGDAAAMDSDGFQASIPLIAKLAALFPGGDNDAGVMAVFLDAAAVLTCADAALAIQATAATLLRSVIVSGAVSREVLRDVGAAAGGVPAGLVDAVLAAPAPEHVRAFVATAKPFGVGCPYPGSFQVALLALVSFPTFVDASRANVMAGGDQCSRAMFLGSVLGAAHGIGSASGVPLDWIERTTAGVSAFETAINLVSE